jgi:ABC-2 type transport system permease protein
VDEKRLQTERQRQELIARLQKELEAAQAQGQGGQNLARKVREAQQKLDFTERANEQDRKEQSEQMTRTLQSNLRRNQRELDLQRLNIQNVCKFLAVALPPIPPLIVALGVFLYRRLREREGVARSRLR